MTLKEYGREYAKRLSLAPKAQVSEVAEQIAREIKGLTMKATGKPLSEQQIKTILDEIHAQLSRGNGVVWFIKEGENKNYLELVNYLSSLLGTN